MGVKYLWNTNTVIYYLQQQFPPQAELFIDNSLKESKPCISAITEIELLCWDAPSEKDMAVLQNFINDSLVIELDYAVKHKTAELRREHKMKIPDAIIAATAIVYQLNLITRNTRDFKKIADISLVDPFEIK